MEKPTPMKKPPLIKTLKVPPPNTVDSNSDNSFPQKAMTVFKTPPSLILPHIYLGSQANAASKKQLLELNIKRILSLKETNTISENTGDFKIISVPMSDQGDTLITEVIPECFNFLDEAKSKKEITLVHWYVFFEFFKFLTKK